MLRPPNSRVLHRFCLPGASGTWAGVHVGEECAVGTELQSGACCGHHGGVEVAGVHPVIRVVVDEPVTGLVKKEIAGAAGDADTADGASQLRECKVRGLCHSSNMLTQASCTAFT